MLSAPSVFPWGWWPVSTCLHLCPKRIPGGQAGPHPVLLPLPGSLQEALGSTGSGSLGSYCVVGGKRFLSYRMRRVFWGPWCPADSLALCSGGKGEGGRVTERQDLLSTAQQAHSHQVGNQGEPAAYWPGPAGEVVWLRGGWDRCWQRYGVQVGWGWGIPMLISGGTLDPPNAHCLAMCTKMEGGAK